MIDKHEENQDGTEELRLEITKLQMLLESRNEELNKAEKILIYGIRFFK